MCLFDLDWWIKVEWDNHVPSVDDMIPSIGSIEVPRKMKNWREHLVWLPPAFEQIKVNVDVFSLGGVDKWGIEGVYRDFKGRVLLQLCK